MVRKMKVKVRERAPSKNQSEASQLTVKNASPVNVVCEGCFHADNVILHRAFNEECQNDNETKSMTIKYSLVFVPVLKLLLSIQSLRTFMTPTFTLL